MPDHAQCRTMLNGGQPLTARPCQPTQDRHVHASLIGKAHDGHRQPGLPLCNRFGYRSGEEAPVRLGSKAMTCCGDNM
ncbi:hypothetical protein SV7mr_08140 [Stieleria bergensis]|uniref:Uncharacterized protein n=1 Tax=Stieleria bergensis TaxID=2528025 RepID=A0A517SQC2_9BACT|nr:hypothetical protein SV7mr_08140 [Planctomycetes bacterium SV_7m_r]